MVFCPSSRKSCEYYGYSYPYDGSKVEERDVFEKQSLMPHKARFPGYPPPVDYYPQQSRDYALSNTIKCHCIACPANKNGYCETPALIEITSGGKCVTGTKFLGETIDPREVGQKPQTKDDFTPDWFFNRYDTNCPKLSKEQIIQMMHTDKPLANCKLDDDIIRVNLEAK